MVMPIEHIPKFSFQCGLESKSIHFVAQEAIRSILTTGLKSILPAYDDTVGDIIETIIEEHSKEDEKGGCSSQRPRKRSGQRHGRNQHHER